jgi:hypothetical protein
VTISKGNLAIDPRGLILEAYRMEGIGAAECRVIFLDWAMTSPVGEMKVMLQILMDAYGNAAPHHPMTALIGDGLAGVAQPKRRSR